MTEPISDKQLERVYLALDEIGQGTKRGRIPFEEAIALLEGLSRKYPVEDSELPILDLDTDPHIPDGWEIRPEDQISSRLTGSCELDVDKINLHLDPAQQKSGLCLMGHKLKRQLESLPVLPAHVLDYLLEHPEEIPDSWKGMPVFFWGTIYRRDGGYLVVRCIFWGGNKWRWHYQGLDGFWGGHSPTPHFTD